MKEILHAGLDDNENLPIGVLLSSLLFQMIKHWRAELKNRGDLVDRLDRLLITTFANVENSAPQLQLAILGSLLHVVQADEDHFGKNGSNLLRSMGSLIQVTLRAGWSPASTPEGVCE